MPTHMKPEIHPKSIYAPRSLPPSFGKRNALPSSSRSEPAFPTRHKTLPSFLKHERHVSATHVKHMHIPLPARAHISYTYSLSRSLIRACVGRNDVTDT